MSAGQLRRAQLVTTFGPGAMLDLPNHAVLVAGLDHWSHGETILEPRLSAKLARLLNVASIELKSPPAAEAAPGARPPSITAFKFPEWFLVNSPQPGLGAPHRRDLVHRRALTKGYFLDRERKRQPVVPVRFVRACRLGHIGDVDWRTYIHGGKTNCNRQLWMKEPGHTGDLAEIIAGCDCGTERDLGVAAQISSGALGHCDGARPWLGPKGGESCNQPNRLLNRSASNAYFSLTMSAISLPDRSERVAQAVGAVWDFLSTAESAADVAHERRKPKVAAALEGVSDEEAWGEIQAMRGGIQAVDKKVKVAELETLVSSQTEVGSDSPAGNYFARALPTASWHQPWMERVVLVHRLREVVALAGFSRFEPVSLDHVGELDLGVERAALSLEANWLPAFENRGEGVFLHFSSQALDAWLARAEVRQRAADLARGFKLWAADRGVQAVFPGPAYYLIHSLSHLLLTAISLRCGYPASSLRERIYAIPDLGYGLLLYTGAPDSDGTLGGLVEQGRQMQDILREALRLALLCSNDPVCSHHDPTSPADKRFLLGAACHGCLLLPETSCERHNEFLDRALVTPTLNAPGCHFFPPPLAGAV